MSDLLKALSNMYEKSSAMNKVYLMQRLFNLQMSEGGSIADHIDEFNKIVSQLSSVDINIKDEIKILILMSSLPESWDNIVAAISSSPGSALSIDERGRSESKGPKKGRSKSKNHGKFSNRPNVTC